MTQPAIDSSAPVSRRAIAYLIDALIAGAIGTVGLVIVAVLTLTPRPVEELLLVLPLAYGAVLLVLLGWFVVYTLMQTRGGSIGMRAQGVRLASAADGMPLGFGRALLRNVVFGAAAGIVVGYFTPLFDGSGRFQGWHDKVSKAVVLDARKSAAPIRRAESNTGASQSTATPGRGIGMPVQPAPVGTPPVPLLPPAPLAGGYAATVSAPPGYPAAAAPAPAAATPTISTPPDMSAPPEISSSPAVSAPPSVRDAPMPSTAGTGSAFSVPSGGAPFAVPSLPPRSSAPESAHPADQAAHPAHPADQGAGQSVTPASAAPAPASDALIAFVPGVTPASAPSPVSPATPAVDPAGSAPGAPAAHESVDSEPVPVDLFEETIVQPRSTPEQLEDELESTRISIPGHRLLFTWDDGTRVTVSRRTLFGRNPSHEDGTERVTVRDETLSLSKTHFEAAAEVSGGWVLDRHSTNGMTIVRDGERIDCPPGQRVPVRLGDAIEIGDRILTIGGYV